MACRRWTFKTAKIEAKKYNKLAHWLRMSHGSFEFAKRNNLVKEFSKHMKSRFVWNYDSVKKDALKYNSKKEWIQSCIGSYQYAVRNKLILEFSSHMKNPRFVWTYESVSKIAKKCKSSSEWVKKSQGSFIWASRKGYLEELSTHFVDLRNNKKERARVQLINKEYSKPKTVKDYKKITQKKYWTSESVFLESKKYLSRSEWKGFSPGSHKFAKKNKPLYKKCCKHMGRPRNGETWSKLKCNKYAIKYNTKKEWREKHPKSYSAAHKHGWVSELSNHMIKLTTDSGYWKNENNIVNEMKKYSSRREFIKAKPGAYTVALKYHQKILNKIFPIIEHSSTSLGEHSTLKFLNVIFQEPFEKNFHNFLINPKTNRALELDGYCKKLNIAFEYGSHEDVKVRTNNKNYKAVLEKDKFKQKRCDELGIKLLQLTTDSLTQLHPADHLKNQIKQELIRLKIQIPSSFDSTPLQINQFKSKKWNEKAIWRAIKKSKGVADLQRKFPGAYDNAKKLGLIDDLRKALKSQGNQKRKFNFND
jgi:hypothetical protein